MLDEFLGLPTHPLLVHGTVVLLPLLALLAAAVAWRGAAWRRAGLPLVVLSALVLLLTFLTKESGEKLEHRLPADALVHEHAELGDVLPLFAGVLLLGSLALWWFGRRAAAPARADGDDARATHRHETGRRGEDGATAVGHDHDHDHGHGHGHGHGRVGAGPAPAVRTTIAALLSVLALATCFWTFRVGHSGAQAVWNDLPAASAPLQEQGASAD